MNTSKFLLNQLLENSDFTRRKPEMQEDLKCMHISSHLSLPPNQNV
jgi:hypothetical protein